MLETPILFVVYRRPEPAARVFRAIADARPRRLLIAADGPRTEAEAASCDRTRDLVQRIDWPCDVSLDFADRNLGLDVRMTSALDWVFSSCDRAIVLEDDCLPSRRFFSFCETMLERYASDRRVVHVSGECYQPSRRSDRSYFFSKYPLAWGWASWRRSWSAFDLAVSSWPAFRASPEARALFDSEDERRYWWEVFEAMYRERLPGGWDYAWYYACMTQGLSIHPAVNLVANIGYGADATHTRGSGPLANRAVGTLEEDLRHPDWVVRDREADLVTFDVRFPGAIMRRQRTLTHHALRPFRWLGRKARI